MKTAISPENLPKGAPSVPVPEETADFYLLVFSDPENKVVPVRLRVVGSGPGGQRRGQTLWINLTGHTILGNLGERKLLIASDSSSIVEAPRADEGDYPVSMTYRSEGDDTEKPICETRWMHDPRARNLGVIFAKEGFRAPRLLVFSDLRLE
jgi:hypothetical protein